MVTAKYETMVKTYKKTKQYSKDAKKLAKKGWEVLSVVEKENKVGGGRMLLLGVFAIFFRPKNELVVTYRRSVT